MQADATTYQTPHARDLLHEVLRPGGARLISVWGGVGTGKSYAIAQVVRVVAETRPGCPILVSGASMNQLHSVLKRRCDKVFGHVAEWVGSSEVPHYEFPSGSLIDFRPYHAFKTREESSNSWEGRDYHLLVVDEIEQLPATVFLHSDERCRLDWRDAWGALYEPTILWVGRPGAVDHWVLKAEEYRAAGRRAMVMRPRTADNPLLSRAYLDNLRASHSPAHFRCITEGAPMPVQGAIYSDWSEDPWPRGNILDGYTVDPTRPVSLGIDFGRNHPAVVWIQPTIIGGVDVDVIVDEWSETETLVPGIVQAISERGTPYSEVGGCDPNGCATNPQSGKSDIDILRRPRDAFDAFLGPGLGVPVYYTYEQDRTSIPAGVCRVQALICDATGRRRLACTREVWERGKRVQQGSWYRTIMHYEWGPGGRPLKGDKGRNADHMADAVRYWVVNRRWNDHHGGIPSLDLHQPAPRRPAWRSY